MSFTFLGKFTLELFSFVSLVPYLWPNGEIWDRIDEKSKNPIFDLTFFNKGANDLILTEISAKVVEYHLHQGSGGDSESSRIIPSLHKYVLTIPKKVVGKLELVDEGGYYNLEIKKSAIPPLLIKGGEPARIQTEIKFQLGLLSTYTIVLKYKFSNGQTVMKKVDIEA